MQIKTFLHLLRLSGDDITGCQETQQDVSFSCIRKYKEDVQIESGVLYVCSMDTLPMRLSFPAFVWVSSEGKAIEEDIRRADTWFCKSSLPWEIWYAHLMTVQAEYAQWKIQMFEALHSYESIQQMVNLTEKYFEFPLAIFDEIGTLVAYTKHIDGSYEPFKELVEKKHILPEALQRIFSSPMLRSFTIEKRQDQDLFFREAVMDKHSKNIYRNCCYKNKVIFRCSFFCHTTAPSIESFSLINEFFEFLDRYIWYHREKIADITQGMEFLLTAIVTESYTDKEYIRFCLAQNNMKSTGPFVLLHLQSSDSPQPEALLQSIQQQELFSACIAYMGDVLVLLPARTEAQICRELRKKKVTGFVSEAFDDIFELHRAYEQTKKMQQIASVLQPVWGESLYFQGKRNVLFAKEIFSYLMLMGEDGQQVVSGSLRKAFLEYCSRSPIAKTDIMKTAYVHIANGCKYNVTAEHLQIHRNTVTNRIKQLEEALEISFDHFEDCINLLFVIKYLELHP